MYHLVALFGEAEKGDFQIGHFCQNLIDLAEKIGGPPTEDSKGVAFAIQALLYQRQVIFFRVHEEGFSDSDYIRGLRYLEDRTLIPHISAICLPGVGSAEIIDATVSACAIHQSFLIITEKDLYDFITSRTILE